jgi:hypothetical protein
LELAFETIALRRLCENRSKAKALLGADAAHELMVCLSELEVADSIDELSWRKITTRSNGAMAIEFFGGCHLVLVSNHRVGNEIEVNWATVDRLKLICVEHP